MIEETNEEEMEENEDDDAEEEDHTHRDNIFQKRTFTTIG